jgi:hypothetical protein
MTFAAPWVLAIAAAAALVVAGLHLLSARRPPELMLPTARFVPMNDVRAVSRTRTPSDLLLLMIRLAALLAAGFALAGPRVNATGDGRVALVAIEPGVVTDTAAIRRVLLTDSLVADARLVFVVDSLSVPTATRNAAYDAAQIFPRAIRVAARLVQADPSIDSLSLVVLRATPPTADRAWWAWRSAWPGRVVTYSPRMDSGAADAQRVARRVVVVSDVTAEGLSSRDVPADDVVDASFRWHAMRLNDGDRLALDRVVVDSIFLWRASPQSATRQTASRSGRVHISWPLNGVTDSGAGNARSAWTWRGWQAASAGDTATALVAGGTAMVGTWSVAQFGTWRPEFAAEADADTPIANVAQRAQPLAWWSDGRVAAIEQYVNGGCERTVAVAAAQGHDVLLSTSANAFFDRLLAPCAPPPARAIDALQVRTVLGAALAPASALRATDPGRASDEAMTDRWGRWIPSLFLALSLVALLLEWRTRRADSEVPA